MHLPFYLQTGSDAPPLRLGLLLDSPVLPSAFAAVIRHIQQSDFARLELLVYRDQAQPDLARSQPALLRKASLLLDGQKRRRLLYNLYQRWDARNADPATDPNAQVDCTADFAGIESLRVAPIVKRFVHRFPEEAVQQIRDKRLDVILRFGFNILRGDILKCARHGVWSYHHGDNDFYRGGPPHFWEMYENNLISGVILQVLTEDLDAGKVLYKGLFATQPGFSANRNRIQPYWGASTFVIQKLAELHRSGAASLEAGAMAPAPYQGLKKLYTAPSNWEMVRWLAPLVARKALGRLTRVKAHRHWRLAIRQGPPRLPSTVSNPSMEGFEWVESPSGRFFADPFLIEEFGRTWVFFEDFYYATERGRITCAEIVDGRLGELIPVLTEPYHLSYPCLFRGPEGELYIVPESGANASVDLYRCTRFPGEWQRERRLFDGVAVDTTVWRQDDLYWFFVTMVSTPGGALQLWLFWSDSPAGDWTPHPQNPISTDVESSRGGGAVFKHGGKLYRPSQDCSGKYGRGLALNEILILNRSQYSERVSLMVEPDWESKLEGTHTYACTGQMEVIDGCWSVPVRDGQMN